MSTPDQALAPIKARLEAVAAIPTDRLCAELAEFGETYKLVARYEADHRRLLSAVESMETLAASWQAVFPYKADQVRAALSEALGGRE